MPAKAKGQRALGARVRYARELQGLSQGRLAGRADLSHHTIRHLELGTRQPTQATLRTVAEALGMTLRELETLKPKPAKGVMQEFLATRMGHLATEAEREALQEWRPSDKTPSVQSLTLGLRALRAMEPCKGRAPPRVRGARLGLGGVVRERRTARGWSQRALAERSGVSNQMVSAVEKGQREPTVEMKARLARALGVNVPALESDTQRTAWPAELERFLETKVGGLTTTEERVILAAWRPHGLKHTHRSLLLTRRALRAIG